MDFDMVTVQDCIDMYEKRGKVAEINDGHITNFLQEGNKKKNN